MDSTTNKCTEALGVVRRFLEKGDWQVEEIPGRYALRAKGEDDLCPRNYYFHIVEQEQFLFYIQPVLKLLPDMLPAVAEFIARANFGMRIGNFEVDYQECQVCFRSSINFKAVSLSEPLVEGVIAPALDGYDEFFPGLVQVIAGIETPANAILAIEYGKEPEDR